MKKMSSATVFVLLMVSATTVFADATCADVSTELTASKARITEAMTNIKQLDELIPQIQATIMMKQIEGKDDSMLLGNGQDRLRNQSFQAVKARAYMEASIRRDEAQIEALKIQYKDQCSSYEKFE